MACSALSEEICAEILEDFRLYLPNISDPLLRELAHNYSFDALVDADTNDFVAVLSEPGPMTVITSDCAEQNGLEDGLSDLLTKATAMGISLATVSGAVLIMKGSAIRFSVVNHVMTAMRSAIHPHAHRLWACYTDRSSGKKISLMLILVGIAMRDEFVGPREGPARPPVFSDDELPEFLRRGAPATSQKQS